MKLVEIAGHLIDPGKVSYVGPLYYRKGPSPRNSFTAPDSHHFDVCVDGRTTWSFICRQMAAKAKRLLLAAIESAQPEMTGPEASEEMTVGGAFQYRRYGEHSCCVSWPKYDDDMQKRIREAVAVLNDLRWGKPQPNEKGEYLWGECCPTHPDPNKSPGGNGAMGASDALVGIEMGPQEMATFSAGQVPVEEDVVEFITPPCLEHALPETRGYNPPPRGPHKLPDRPTPKPPEKEN